MPVGLATVIGARPGIASDLSPRLPSAPPCVLDGATVSGGDGTDPAALAAVVDFLDAHRDRTEPVVMSITGPVTLELELRRDGHDADRAAELARDAVVAVAHDLLAAADERLDGASVMVFLLEPALANSMHPTFPLGSDEIEARTTAVVDAVAVAHPAAVVGVQVDGRADWAMLLRTGIGALAAPVTGHLEIAAAEIGRFLTAGGLVVWGAVPVDEPLGQSAERLWKRLSELWCELARRGVDPLLLRERSIISPAATIGNFGVSQAERILALTEELATKVLHQTLGVRLSIGA